MKLKCYPSLSLSDRFGCEAILLCKLAGSPSWFLCFCSPTLLAFSVSIYLFI